MTVPHPKPRRTHSGKARSNEPQDSLSASDHESGVSEGIAGEETLPDNAGFENDVRASVSSHRTHSARVFEEIERALVNGDIPLGSRLGEEQLSRRFGVSRGPMREALRQLEGRGLVVRLPHSGARVVSLDAKDFAELYEIRASLEGLACRLGAQNMTQASFDKLSDLLQRHKAGEDLQADRSYHQDYGDLDFHYLLAKECGSDRLKELLCRDLYSLLRLFRFKTSQAPGRPLRAITDHEHILAAMSQRDGELAEILMKRHIAAAGRELQAVFMDVQSDGG